MWYLIVSIPDLCLLSYFYNHGARNSFYQSILAVIAESNVLEICDLRSYKKIPVFRVTRTYLYILVKPSFFRFSGKNIILCILKGILPFKMHKIMFP